jgi:hypothetical protein
MTAVARLFNYFSLHVHDCGSRRSHAGFPIDCTNQSEANDAAFPRTVRGLRFYENGTFYSMDIDPITSIHEYGRTARRVFEIIGRTEEDPRQ